VAINLRPHQITACEDINRHFDKGAKNVCCVLPTGAGKSLTLASFAKRALERNELTLVFAHRDVLISQLSEALCKMGVSHSFICSDKARRDITNNNLELFGDSFYNENSPVIVSSTPTFAARLKAGKIPVQFLQSVKLWLQDETHHLVTGTTWFSCIDPMINAKGIGFTATPIRGDKKGLGRKADGVFDALSVTTTMFDLIKKSMLTPYKIYATGKFDAKSCDVTGGGDYNQKKLVMKVNNREIIGDAVEHYLKHTHGVPAITFCVNIEHAKAVAAQFNEAGVPSIAISSKSELAERKRAMEDFKARRILNLVNVDLLGEGYDCPAVTVVIMLRPTQSYSLFKQQLGRMLRPADGKSHGILLDHVGNTQFFMTRMGLRYPHDDPEWTLERVEPKVKKSGELVEDSDIPDTITCGNCQLQGIVKPAGYVPEFDEMAMVFIDGTCPECGWHETEKEKESRQRDLKVQAGVLQELSFDIIETLIEQRNNAMVSVQEFRKTVQHAPFVHAAVNNHANRQHALSILRHWIQEWCLQRHTLTGQSVPLVQIDFELTFGINIFKAQAQTASQMTELVARIQHKFNEVK